MENKKKSLGGGEGSSVEDHKTAACYMQSQVSTSAHEGMLEIVKKISEGQIVSVTHETAIKLIK